MSNDHKPNKVKSNPKSFYYGNVKKTIDLGSANASANLTYEEITSNYTFDTTSRIVVATIKLS